MLWRTGFLSQPLTWPRIHIPRHSFETMVWITSSCCVLELKYSKAGIPIFFSHQASTWRTLPLMTDMPCFDTVLWIFWHNFHLPVQKRCVVRAPFERRWCLHQKATWISSRVLGTQYLINWSKILIPPFCNASFIVENVYRMVHAFTCAGVLSSQCTKMTQFGGGDAYVRWGMNDYSPHIFHCLFTVYQQMGTNSPGAKLRKSSKSVGCRDQSTD